MEAKDYKIIKELDLGTNPNGQELDYMISVMEMYYLIPKHCLDKDNVSNILENKSIEYQEEATTKWSSPEERIAATIRLETIEILRKELKLDDV